MKKIVGLLVVVLLVSATINAQGNKNRDGQKNEFTPEQMATLQTKRMTLNLDLNKNQQEAIYELQKNQMLVHQAMRTAMLERKVNENPPTSDKLFQLQNSRLDRMKLHSDSVKKILTPKQFEKWELFNTKKMRNKSMSKSKNSRKIVSKKV